MLSYKRFEIDITNPGRLYNNEFDTLAEGLSFFRDAQHFIKHYCRLPLGCYLVPAHDKQSWYLCNYPKIAQK